MPEQPSEQSAPADVLDWEAVTREAKAADESLTDKTDDASSDQGEAARATQLTAEQEEQVRKDVMYSALSFGLQVPNVARSWRGEPELQSLTLAKYGTVGRQASDQLHDELMKLPWFEKAFGPVNQFLARYGAIVALTVTMRQNVAAELAEIETAKAAKTAEGEADEKRVD